MNVRGFSKKSLVLGLTATMALGSFAPTQAGPKECGQGALEAIADGIIISAMSTWLSNKIIRNIGPASIGCELILGCQDQMATKLLIKSLATIPVSYTYAWLRDWLIKPMIWGDNEERESWREKFLPFTIMGSSIIMSARGLDGRVENTMDFPASGCWWIFRWILRRFGQDVVPIAKNVASTAQTPTI